MLPFNTCESEQEKLQWAIYQLKVVQKLFSQYARAADSGNEHKMSEICDLIYNYGSTIISDEFEFDLEKNLMMLEIFEEMRDLR